MSTKRNLLFVVHQFLPRHIAGTELYTWNLARALAARGHDVTVYTTEAHAGDSTSVLREKQLDGLKIWEAVHNNGLATFEHSYLDPEKEQQFRRVLDATEPELVHVQHLNQHSLGYLDVLERLGTPIVYTLHEFSLMCLRFGWLVRPGWVLCDGPVPEECARCSEWMPEPALDSDRTAAVERRLATVRSALSRVDLFLSPSRFLRDRFLANGFVEPDRILYSDNGLPLADYGRHEREHRHGLTIGFVGTIAEWKGVHLLVEAVNGLPASGVECQIHGVLEYFPDYVERLRTNAVHPGIRFLGRYDNDRIAEILSGIDVLVVPSLWYENSPITIHEAFLAGTPVIAADKGGMAEYVDDGRNGLHFRIGDADDLRAKLLRLIEEPGLLSTLHEFPRLKSIEEDAELMEVRYETLLAGKTPRS